MESRTFTYFETALESYAGIRLDCFDPESRRRFLRASLRDRVRALGLSGLADYRRYLIRNSGRERQPFIDAVTISRSHFFRAPSHFRYLTDTYLPARQASRPRHALRIWSAGCASGEEAFSLGLVADRFFGGRPGKFEITGSDVNSASIEFARFGLFPEKKIRTEVPSPYLRSFRPASGHFLAVPRRVSTRVSFQTANLLRGPLPEGPFDLVFCRNVLTYFSPRAAKRALARMAERVPSGGLLFTAHYDRITLPEWKERQRSIYERR